ncbi:MAG: GDSL-type esterase/lipase family protein [Nitriliruptoraceae bacterium]
MPVLSAAALLATTLPVALRIRRLRAHAADVPRLAHDLELPGWGSVRTVAVLGDSAAAGHGLADPELALARRVGRGLWSLDGRATEVRCAAVSGADTAVVLASQLPVARDAEVVVVGVGVNDALSPRRRLRSAERSYDALLDALTAEGGAAVVAITSPDLSMAPGLPAVLRPVVGWRCRGMARRQHRVARRHGVVTIALPRSALPRDVLGDDGFHPGIEGHRRLALAVLRELAGGDRPAGPTAGEGQAMPAPSGA